MTLTEFLLARIAEDEAAAAGYGEPRGTYDVVNGIEFHPHDGILLGQGRLLGECEIKRALVRYANVAETHRGDSDWDRGIARAANFTVSMLVLAYDEHPDYREEWRP